MKTLIIALALVLGSAKGYACSPALYSFYYQTRMISEILDSEVVSEELKKAVGEDPQGTHIVSINNGKDGYSISLSNGCSVAVVPQWKQNVPPGLCPEVESYKATSACK